MALAEVLGNKNYLRITKCLLGSHWIKFCVLIGQSVSTRIAQATPGGQTVIVVIAICDVIRFSDIVQKRLS